MHRDVTIVPRGQVREGPRGIRKRIVMITVRDSQLGGQAGQELAAGRARAARRAAAASMSAAAQVWRWPCVGAPDLAAVGPDGQVGGDGDDGEFLGGGGVDAGDAVPGQRAGQGWRRPGRGWGARRGGVGGNGSGGCIGSSLGLASVIIGPGRGFSWPGLGAGSAPAG